MRSLAGIAIASLVIAAATTSSARADQSFQYDFGAGGAQGWSQASSSCGLLGAISVGCTITSDYAGDQGNPSGAYRTRYTSPANALGLLSGTSRIQSAPFTVQSPSGATVKGASFTIDHRLTADAGVTGSAGLPLPIGAQSAYTVSLVDQASGGATTQLDKQTLTDSTAGFATTGGAVSASALQLGHTYRLVIDTTQTATGLQAALVNVTTYFDNIDLVVDDGTTNGTAAAGAVTLPATNVGRDGATLNGLIDTHGSSTSYQFDVGTSASALSTSTTPVTDTDPEGPRAQSGQATNLSTCQTYFFRAHASNANNAGVPTLGQVLSFATNCKPDVQTLAAAPLSATTAGLNSSINPRGEATTYHYDYGTSTSYGTSTPDQTAGSGRDTILPNDVPVAGLQPNTLYHFRIVAANALGTSTGADGTFTTPVQSGPGAAGTPGTNGTPGAPGAPGPAGQSGVPSNVTLANGDARALVRFRSKYARVGQKGARKGQIRIPISCSTKALRTCAGTIKIRTVSKINPSSLGKKKTKVRVTFATISYQLAAGKSGYAIGTSSPEKLRRMGQLKSIHVDLSAQVADAGGVRQTVISHNATYKAQKTV